MYCLVIAYNVGEIVHWMKSFEKERISTCLLKQICAYCLSIDDNELLTWRSSKWFFFLLGLSVRIENLDQMPCLKLWIGHWFSFWISVTHEAWLPHANCYCSPTLSPRRWPNGKKNFVLNSPSSDRKVIES